MATLGFEPAQGMKSTKINSLKKSGELVVSTAFTWLGYPCALECTSDLSLGIPK